MEVVRRACRLPVCGATPSTSGRQHDSCGWTAKEPCSCHSREAFSGPKWDVNHGLKRGVVHVVGGHSGGRLAWNQELSSGSKDGLRQTTVAQALKIDRSKASSKSDLARGQGDDELCPLNCVKEVFSHAELQQYLEDAGPHSLVVVDFFRTACGSCRYIEKGFMKLCKGESEDEERGGQHHVVFLKHNVMNEYEEQSDIAEEFRIKVVPLFHFYKGGKLVDSFATRDKNRLLATIYRHTNRESEIAKLEV